MEESIHKFLRSIEYSKDTLDGTPSPQSDEVKGIPDHEKIKDAGSHSSKIHLNLDILKGDHVALSSPAHHDTPHTNEEKLDDKIKSC